MKEKAPKNKREEALTHFLLALGYSDGQRDYFLTIRNILQVDHRSLLCST